MLVSPSPIRSDKSEQPLSPRLAPLFLMHILLPTVERRHKHHNTDQVVSGKSHRLCYHARSPSRPNLEAPNAPSSILSPQVHDHSASSVVPIPRSARLPPTLNLPIICSRNTLHRHLSSSLGCIVVCQLLIRFELSSSCLFSPLPSLQRESSVVIRTASLKP